jgi:hypothetical protein
MLSVNAVESGHGVSVDGSAKGEHVVSFCLEFHMMHIDCSFNRAGLFRAFEEATELVSVLSNLHVLYDRQTVVNVHGIDRLIAFNAIGAFLCRGGGAEDKQGKKKARQLPHVHSLHDILLLSLLAKMHEADQWQTLKLTGVMWREFTSNRKFTRFRKDARD